MPSRSVRNFSKVLAVFVAMVLSSFLATSLASANNSKKVSAQEGYLKSQCKQGGWEDQTDDQGTKFKNQGDCVSFYATGGRNKADGR